MDAVVVERPNPQVAVVRLNRPEARNALNQQVRMQLAEHFTALGRDPDVRAIVFTGGDKYFAAGADFSVTGVLRDGLDSSPGITLIGDTVYVVEGKIQYLFNPEFRGKDPGPFKAIAIPLPIPLPR